MFSYQNGYSNNSLLLRDSNYTNFTLRELNLEIDNKHNLSSPPSDPDFVSEFMVKLAKDSLSKDVKKAKEYCYKAINTAKYIDKLTGEDLVTMPLVKQQKFGSTDI